MVRTIALCQKLEPMPILILQILDRAGIAHWFRDFEATVIRNEAILGGDDNQMHYSQKKGRAAKRAVKESHVNNITKKSNNFSFSPLYFSIL
jgi:hypothetical protein